MSVYSTLFFLGTVGVTQITAYTVPAGYVAVIREIDARDFSGAVNGLYIASNVSGFGTFTWSFLSNVAGGDAVQWKGRTVLPAASTILLAAGAASFQAAVSGYLLTD